MSSENAIIHTKTDSLVTTVLQGINGLEGVRGVTKTSDDQRLIMNVDGKLVAWEADGQYPDTTGVGYRRFKNYVSIIAGFENPSDLNVVYSGGKFIASAPIAGSVIFYSDRKQFIVPNGSALLQCNAPTDSRRVRLYFNGSGQLVCPNISDDQAYYNNSILWPSVIDAYIDTTLGEISMVRAAHHYNIDPRFVESSWRTGSIKYISGITPDCDINGTRIGFTGGEFRDIERKCSSPAIAKTTAVWPVYYSEGADAMAELRLRRLPAAALNNKPFIVDSELSLGSTGRLIYNYKSGGVFAVGVIPTTSYAWIHAFYADGLLGSMIFVTPQAYYSSRSAARAGITKEISSIELNQYARVSIPLFSFLVDQVGQIQWADEASTEKWVDHRNIAVGSSGSSSVVFPGTGRQILVSNGAGGVAASTAVVDNNGNMNIVASRQYLINGVQHKHVMADLTDVPAYARRDTTNDFTQHNVFSSGRIGVGSSIRGWSANASTIDFITGTLWSLSSGSSIYLSKGFLVNTSGQWVYDSTKPSSVLAFDDSGISISQSVGSTVIGQPINIMDRFKISQIGSTIDGSAEPFCFASNYNETNFQFKPNNYVKWVQSATTTEFNLWFNSAASGNPVWSKKFSLNNLGVLTLMQESYIFRPATAGTNAWWGFGNSGGGSVTSPMFFVGKRSGSEDFEISLYRGGSYTVDPSIIIRASGDVGGVLFPKLANGGNRMLTVDNNGLVGAATEDIRDKVILVNGVNRTFTCKTYKYGKVVTVTMIPQANDLLYTGTYEDFEFTLLFRPDTATYTDFYTVVPCIWFSTSTAYLDNGASVRLQSNNYGAYLCVGFKGDTLLPNSLPFVFRPFTFTYITLD